MEKALYLVFLLAMLGRISDCKDASKLNSGRESRKYDKGFSAFAAYYNPDESTEESTPEPPTYSDAGSKPEKPQLGDKFYDPNQDIKSFEDKYYFPPSYPVFYKGYPYAGKGSLGSSLGSPAQMAEMMKMMKELQSASSEEEPGFLAKIFTDPKPILLFALVPVSIMLASFIPLLVNYFMTGQNGPSVLSTVASSKLARSLGDVNHFLTLIESLDKYGRKLESYQCLEEAACHFVTDNSEKGDAHFVKSVLRVLSKVVKSEWASNSKFASVLSGIKHKNCSNICEKGQQKKKKGDLLM